MRFYLILLFLLLSGNTAAAQTIPADETASVILAYHRIGEDEYPASNLRQEQFEEQIHELANGSYHVMPLTEIIAALKNGTQLPDHTIAITLEGGYKSQLKNAVPLLIQNNLPFTVFFASALVDGHGDQYMDWHDLKSLQQNKLASLGILPASFSHFAGRDKTSLLSDINQARTRTRDMLGLNATLFSYPFGEYNLAYRKLVQDQGFDAAFGLNSGVAYAGSDMFTLPRFTMTESYGDIDRFEMVVNALPLPVSHIEPEDPLLTSATPLIGFSVDDSLKSQIAHLSCFITGERDLKMETVSDTRIELRLSAPLLEDRNRINCTIPVGESDNQRWRWFGMVLMNNQESVDEDDSANTEQAPE